MSALALLLVAACGRPAATGQKAPAAGEWRTFEGNWTASGTRTSLDLESDHRASIVQMNGSLLLKGERALGIGFRAEFVGFTDSRSGMVGRAVWTDERGDRVFSELKGEWVGTGNHIAGTFLGGTGRYAGSPANTNSSGNTCWPPRTAPVGEPRAQRTRASERATGIRAAGWRPEMTAPDLRRRTLIKQGLTFAVAIGIWLTPVPEGLTAEAWHLFAIFAAAILSVILNAFPLLTAAMLAVAAAVLTRAVDPNKAFAGFANPSVLLVVIAFLVAYGVVKSGLGARLSLMVVSVFGGSTLGLGYSIFLTDAVIAPAFPSNTARGGVLFPIVLSLAQNAGSKPDDEGTRRLGGYLMFCGMASLAVSSALWLTATSVNPIGV
jgi:hypothetical protein